jgi:hypothetical protein
MTGPQMTEAKPGMCLLVFIGDAFSLIANGQSRVLLQNMYLRQNVFPQRYVRGSSLLLYFGSSGFARTFSDKRDVFWDRFKHMCTSVPFDKVVK